MRRVGSSLLWIAAWLTVSAPLLADGEERRDVTVYLDGNVRAEVAKSHQPEVRFNGLVIGKGRDGLAEVLKKIEALPPGSSVVWGPDNGRCGACSGDEKSLDDVYPVEWQALQAIVQKRQLYLSADYPGPFPRRARRPGELPIPQPGAGERIVLAWDNYRGPDTPADEVLYTLNGQFLGRGEAALRKALAAVERAKAGDTVVWPVYAYGGRWASEMLSREELERQNQRLREIHPLGPVRQQLEAVISSRKLKFEPESIQPDVYSSGPRGIARTWVTPPTVVAWQDAWQDGDRTDTFAALGRIVTHDQRASAAAAKLSWSAYDGAQLGKDRKPETTAMVTLNGTTLGPGVAGFAAAMDKLAALPEGSVVHVRTAIRTQAPFFCPITYEDRRHFERTGYEPWIGMLAWLEAVAIERKLAIEWIPDEGKTLRHCEWSK